MILTASVEMSKADLDSLTDADLRWLENEVSRLLKDRLTLAFEVDIQSSGSGCNHPSEFVRQRLDSTYWCQKCRTDLGLDYKAPRANDGSAQS